jgi:phage shock protein E
MKTTMPTATHTAKITALAALLIGSLGIVSLVHAASDAMTTAPNPQIDAKAFRTVTSKALQHREQRRVTEAEFLRMANEPGTVVLDARSSEKFRALHVQNAVNLSFPDITAESLAELIPNKNIRVLIYCNNNFANAPAAFPTKLPSASLNLSTYTALYNYGYRNVYELGPFVDVKVTKLTLLSSR